MERNLWAPWRMAYIRGLESDVAEARAGGGDGGNFLLEAWGHADRDEANLVVHRDRDGMLMLNRYPYANGHLLVALGDPRPRLLDYGPQARAAFWRLVDTATLLVERCMHPQGVNVGLNQGRAGGAGLPEHVHAHVLPRWNGDTNFMATVAGARVIPEALESVAAAYRRTMPQVLDAVVRDPDRG